MSRLELCLSSCDRCRLSFNDFSPDDFEIIDDHYNDECGFIPSKFFKRLKIQEGRSVLQMRLFCGKIGWAKGLLLEVRDNIDKIQITKDMIKVPPSKRKDRHEKVVMIINDTFPSAICRKLDAMLDPKLNFVPPDRKKMGKFEKQKYNKIINVTEMIADLWKQFSVPEEVINDYQQGTRKSIYNVKHVSVMGVVDPTGTFPEGHVFITGHTRNKNGKRVQFGYTGKKIFVARYPCLVERDTALWPMVSKQPKDMLKEDWDQLCRIGFGLIIFSRPKSKGKISMPQMLSGDLDGDFYFICWEDKIIKDIHHSEGLTSRIQKMMNKRRANKKVIKKVASIKRSATDWFTKVQNIMVDLETRYDHQNLVSTTYRLVEKLRKETHVNHKNVLTVDAAYKQALDLKKHGGQLDLPKHLYQKNFPESRHKYFSKHKS